MKPKEKGDIAAANAISYFMMNGYEVCLPIGDKRPYDLIVETGGKLSRVQVKYAGWYIGDKKHKAALRTMGGNKSSYTVKKYKDDDFDLLFVYLENGRKFILPWRDLNIRNSLAIEASKYASYEVK
ncbi:MAG: group I intron-associated PD-(D/E)XK endonuclease [bacterium]|nr:group I intron-associated PD-(D/E)XK endonuclease [bacterium]